MSDTAMNGSMTFESSGAADIHQLQRGPGAQLAAQRQIVGWSVEQVATQLNLAPRQILAIEADNYAALPGMVSARGFIRSYAKLLKMEAAPLLAMIAKDVAPSEPILQRRVLSEPFFDSRLPLMSRSGLRSKSTVVTILVVLLLAGLFAGHKKGWLPPLAETSSLPVKDEQTLASAPGQDASAPTTAVTELLQRASAGAGASAVVEPSVASAVTAVVPSGAASTPAVRDEAARTKDLLVLKLREDSWVEIKRANNSVMISRVVKAGSTETFDITEPVFLTVGNAAGVDATLRDKPLELQSGSSKNVARLNLK